MFRSQGLAFDARRGQRAELRASTTSGPSAAAVPNSAPCPRPSSTPASASRQHTATRLPTLPWPRVPASICGRRGGGAFRATYYSHGEPSRMLMDANMLE